MMCTHQDIVVNQLLALSLNSNASHGTTQLRLEYPSPRVLNTLKQLPEGIMEITGLPKLPVLSTACTVVANDDSLKEHDLLHKVNEFIFTKDNDCVNTSSHGQNYTQENPYPAQVKSCKIVSRPNATNTIISLKLDTSSMNMNMNWKWQPGDAIGILPLNPPSMIDSLLPLLGIQDGVVYYQDKLWNIRDLLMTRDFSCTLKKSSLRLLSTLTTSRTERNVLLYLSSRLGSKEYTNVISQSPTLLDILTTFPGLKGNIKLEHVLELYPLISPRWYSIASDPNDPSQLEIVFSVARNGNDAVGLLTPQLYNHLFGFGLASHPGNKTKTVDTTSTKTYIHIFPRPFAPALKLLPSIKDLLVIAGGTGLAGVWSHVLSRSSTNQHTTILYGTRGREWLWKDEMHALVKNGHTSISVAVSRQYEDIVVEVDRLVDIEIVQGRVQTLMDQKRQSIYETLTSDANQVMICGSLGFVKDVSEYITGILETIGDMSKVDAVMKMKEFEKLGKLCKEGW